MIDFYHDRDIDVLKPGCTSSDLANICLHRSTDAKFYSFTEGDKDFLEEVREDVAGVSSIVFTRRAIVDVTSNRKQQSYANLMLGLMLSNYSPTRYVNPSRPVFIIVEIYIQRRGDSCLDKTRPVVLKIRSSPISNEQNPNAKLNASTLQSNRRKMTASVLMNFFVSATLCSKQFAVFINFVPVEKYNPLLTEKNIKLGYKKGELDDLRRNYKQEENLTVIETWECEYWRMYKTTANVKHHDYENFL